MASPIFFNRKRHIPPPPYFFLCPLGMIDQNRFYQKEIQNVEQKKLNLAGKYTPLIALLF